MFVSIGSVMGYSTNSRPSAKPPSHPHHPNHCSSALFVGRPTLPIPRMSNVVRVERCIHHTIFHISVTSKSFCFKRMCMAQENAIFRSVSFCPFRKNAFDISVVVRNLASIARLFLAEAPGSDSNRPASHSSEGSPLVTLGNVVYLSK